MGSIIFNNEIFNFGDYLIVTYIENRMYCNLFWNNTFKVIEQLLYDDEYGFYLQSEFDDIPFIRPLKDNRFSNLILKIEHLDKVKS